MTESNLESTTGYLSLADLAGMNTDAIVTLTSRVPHAGVFRVVGTKVEGKESPGVEGKPPLIRFNYQYEIVSGTLVDKTIDIETVLGKKLTESYTLWPDQLAELLGLLKGRYQIIGLPNAGTHLGGLEGMEPGWLDGIVGHEFDLRVRTYVSKGETRAAFDYLKPVITAPAEEEVA